MVVDTITKNKAEIESETFKLRFLKSLLVILKMYAPIYICTNILIGT
jgi:hypothetical protein